VIKIDAEAQIRTLKNLTLVSLSRSRTPSYLIVRRLRPSLPLLLFQNRRTSTIASSSRPCQSMRSSPRPSRVARSTRATISSSVLMSSLMNTAGMLLMPARSGVSAPIPLDPICWSMSPREFNTSTKSRILALLPSNGQQRKVLLVKRTCVVSASTFSMLL